VVHMTRKEFRCDFGIKEHMESMSDETVFWDVTPCSVVDR
jgi:hypothetical protein